MRTSRSDLSITTGATSTLVLLFQREAPWAIASGVSWLAPPLVAGLFVMVEAVKQAGLSLEPNEQFARRPDRLYRHRTRATAAGGEDH